MPKTRLADLCLIARRPLDCPGAKLAAHESGAPPPSVQWVVDSRPCRAQTSHQQL
jgi:hypothetical protein